ncbi:preprotein translocase subunit SecD [Actinoplanes philippinensis]|uniref:Protein translocase subunit SecD n=1 Tax=Actinoplanes philippinensis TaxID=35752 RepID=A0A1I2F421_9ACTN|nr:protein translocase subunit SecD [Actinoplanes philippinensis]SFF00112.1 preprotein translocase subunit SecD [Actinoplanes philippinensis]
MHPGRQLGVLGLVFAVLYLLVFFAAGASGSWRDRLEPKLGLDLIGGTQATYIASQAGGTPAPDAMEKAREIIQSRVDALGVSEAEVVIQGQDTIVVSLAGEAKEQLKSLGQAANMRFRLLTGVTGDVAATAINPPSAAPSAPASGAPAASGAASAKPSGGASGAPEVAKSAPTGGQGGGAEAPSPSVAPSAAPSAAAPAPTASAAAPAPVAPNVQALRAEIAKKVGPAWAAAEKLTAPVDLTTDPAAGLPFKAFASLTGEEVNALDPKMQFNVPTIGCQQLDQRPNGAIDDINSEVVACYQGAKVLLDKAEVVGDDISEAAPQLDSTTNQWVVSLDFKSEGQTKWAGLTRKAFQAGATEPCYIAASAFGSQGEVHCSVAVVLDKTVISAPQIQAVLTGKSQITGDFDAVSAKQLADQLNFGAIPVTFQAGPAQTITATVGSQQLEAGLLAAAIGLGLVAIYAFFYYRLLGLVIFLSLFLSALLTFGALVFLGRSIGFTLTLAGIVGFIVSLGVAADSFVIYFERLKDEIHEGRSPRSAVPRAWQRAKRTILSANAITIMCAVVLYIVSIGQVQGLAFALGLSTVLDLIVVFLFRHPIMTVLASTKAFLSPRVSGLGRVLRSSQTEEPVSSRVKEA